MGTRASAAAVTQLLFRRWDYSFGRRDYCALQFLPLISIAVNCLCISKVLDIQLRPPVLTGHMHINILHHFCNAEQQYLLYLHNCKGRFRVGVGLDVNKIHCDIANLIYCYFMVRFCITSGCSCTSHNHGQLQVESHVLFSRN